MEDYWKANLSIARTMRHLRKDRGMTQAELGSLLGVSRNFISDRENGRLEFSAALLVVLAKIFRTTPDYLTGFSPEAICGETHWRRTHLACERHRDHEGPHVKGTFRWDR